jgi:hypothetical protein
MRRLLLAGAAAVLVTLAIAGSASAATTDALFVQLGYGQGGFPPAVSVVAVPLSGSGACSLGATSHAVQGLLSSLKVNGCSMLPPTLLPLGGVNDWPRSQATEVAVCAFP